MPVQARTAMMWPQPLLQPQLHLATSEGQAWTKGMVQTERSQFWRTARMQSRRSLGESGRAAHVEHNLRNPNAILLRKSHHDDQTRTDDQSLDREVKNF